MDGNGRPVVVFEIVTGNWKSILLTTKSKNKGGEAVMVEKLKYPGGRNETPLTFHFFRYL